MDDLNERINDYIEKTTLSFPKLKRNPSKVILPTKLNYNPETLERVSKQLTDMVNKMSTVGGSGSGRLKGSYSGSKLAGCSPSGHPQFKMGGGEHINKPRKTGKFQTTYGHAGGK